MTNGTATYIRSVKRNERLDQRLYRLFPPLAHAEYPHDDDECRREYEYVIVSAARLLDGAEETFIFPSDESGVVTCWLELYGSFKGARNHEKALKRAGYDVLPSKTLDDGSYNHGNARNYSRR